MLVSSRAAMVGVFLMSALMVGATGCGLSEEDCEAGGVCQCGLVSGTCTRHCIDAACNFDCDVGVGVCDMDCFKGHCTGTIDVNGSSNVHCDGGGCDMTVGWNGTHVMECSGNNCKMTCHCGNGICGPDDSCAIVGCTKGCELTCRKGMTCHKPCDGPGCVLVFN